jgi:caa(3)-type oxidase subunit IV
MDLLDPRVIHKEHTHPKASTYFKVAVVLFVLTAAEVAAYEVARRELPGGVAALVTRVLVPLLIVLSAAKFAMVAAFSMHLKQDASIYSGLFVFPMTFA